MIETERLWLRAWHGDDAYAVHDILGDPSVMQYSDKGALTKRAQAQWLLGAVSPQTIDTLPVCLAITRKQDGRCLGYVSLSCDCNRVGPNDAEIGFRLAQWAWSQGYATEAAQEMISTASAREETHRISAIVDPNNRRSIRVLKKLGMSLKGGVMLDGYDYADHLYAINMCDLQ